MVEKRRKGRNFPSRAPPFLYSPCIMFMTSTLLRFIKSHVTSVCSCIQHFQESTECSLRGRRKKGGGEGKTRVKRDKGNAHTEGWKSTSESTIPETTTYHIDYLGKVTSCFSSSTFLMTFKFVAQPLHYLLVVPNVARFQSSLSKDPREKLRRAAFGRRFGGLRLTTKHHAVIPTYLKDTKLN